jgi:cation:H+ antiporter
MESLLFFSIVALLSLIVIILAAKYLVDSITSYARKTGFSNYIVGFLVVAIGTALPDLSTGIMAAIAGRSELALGDAIGANILIVTLVLGLTLIIMKRYKNKDRSIGRTM